MFQRLVLILIFYVFSPHGAVSPPRSEDTTPPGLHPRLAMPTPLAGGRLTLPGLLGQLPGQVPPPGWPGTLPPALAGLNPALFKSGTDDTDACKASESQI